MTWVHLTLFWVCLVSAAINVLHIAVVDQKAFNRVGGIVQAAISLLLASALANLI